MNNEPSPLHITAAQAQALDSCGHGALIGINPDEKKAIVIPMTCKSWACPKCRPAKIAQWVLTARAGAPQRLITLTWKPDPCLSTLQTFHAFVSAFSKLWKRINHTFGRSAYMKVYELHRSGVPHLHILQRGPYIPQQWLSTNWQACGGGPIVDIRKILYPEKAAIHLMKYLGKRIARTVAEFPTLRLITKSKDFLPENYHIKLATGLAGYNWSRSPTQFWLILSAFASAGAVRINPHRRTCAIELDLSHFHLSKGEVENTLPETDLWLIHCANLAQETTTQKSPLYSAIVPPLLRASRILRPSVRSSHLTPTAAEKGRAYER